MVYIPEQLFKKNPNSLMGSLAHIIAIEPGERTYKVKKLNGRILVWHVSALVDAHANKTTSTQNIEMFQNPQ